MSKDKMLDWLDQGSISIPKLLLQNYVQIGLNEQELMLILHVYSFIEQGNKFPTPNELAIRMTLSTEECTDILRLLLKRSYIRIEEGSDEHGKINEQYSLQPLWEKVLMSFVSETAVEEPSQEDINLYVMFEEEFGRPLSPFEGETLSMWLDQDQYNPIIIKTALREAVLSGKLNFRYIDRILFEWKKNGIKTVEQAQSYGKNIRKHQQKRSSTQEGEYKRTIPFYNWLEQQ
ncbi:DnaD domain-containing protein [Cytobacillus sp. IB215665]|uniref:DnaD domain-containing protein n=1 Tax=Cytobacillus sp. IB215665 TaxID=3097357 RepID=UPI002A0DD822|nr:DnaD domain-containing protein [Cytobacillus sp. IB215665]MDX8366472.1 DnaD domain-containing protein [Cytobacillus sp. IB215665]